MSETQNITPGPWKWEKYIGYEALENNNGAIILACETEEKADKADKNLISAAPDMYEALGELYGYMEEQFRGSNFQPMLCRAYRALQKAKGEEADPRKHNRHYCELSKPEPKAVAEKGE